MDGEQPARGDEPLNDRTGRHRSPNTKNDADKYTLFQVAVTSTGMSHHEV